MKTIEFIDLTDRNGYVKFEDKTNLGKWFTYKTNYPENGAETIVWFDMGIYLEIKHFNINQKGLPEKERSINPRFWDKWQTEVIVRQESGPHKQVIPFEETLCSTRDEAIQTASKYVNLYQNAARDAQISHMNTFSSKSLT